MQCNRANQKISIHHLYSKNHLPINNVCREGANFSIPAPTHIYPAVISPIRQHNQYQQNMNGVNAARLSPKKINTSHFVLGEPVGYTHSNVLPPKYKPFQPSTYDTYTNLNSSLSKQTLQNTKSTPNFQKEFPNISINRSLQVLHQNNPVYHGQSFYKNTETRDKEKDQRIEYFFNQTQSSNDEEQIRNILSQYKQVIDKKTENNTDSLDRCHGENVLQAQQSLQQMKNILEDLIRIKRQEIVQREKKYQRNKNMTSRIQNLLKTKIRCPTQII